MTCTEEEVTLMPIKDGSASIARLVDRGCHNFIRKRSGRVLKATEDQMILMQVWRIPCERMGFNRLSERPEEAVGVYAKDDCLIPAGMGKYIHPGAAEWGYYSEILIEISDTTIPGLVLPKIVYTIKKKLGCIFVENHNS